MAQQVKVLEGKADGLVLRTQVVEREDWVTQAII